MPESGNSDIILVYFIGSVGMLLLAGGILFFFVAYQKRLLKKEIELNKVKADQQKEIIRNTILAQEKERKRIAQDLHDEVGAMLSVIKINLGRLEKKSETNESKILASETKSYLDDTIKQVRRISRALLPPTLEKLGLYIALEELTNWVNKSDQIEIECWKSGEEFRFDSQNELILFRMIQELLNNAIKHSEANKIDLNVRFFKNTVSVAITDNGKGFILAGIINRGLGLKNLESRAQIINAKFKLKSKPGKGTSAIICLNSR